MAGMPMVAAFEDPILPYCAAVCAACPVAAVCGELVPNNETRISVERNESADVVVCPTLFYVQRNSVVVCLGNALLRLRQGTTSNYGRKEWHDYQCC